ncbi:fatty-acid amide hydrolase 2-B isoform X2 [Leptopilina heterotoma]|uniref:fatty-acid amide hydrolase 2-B isoform X2 n=1 Tax=Leptopilina heterotoma TaxID=63436 RepID=UPI001CA7E81C|nr:fatty-acid amide hydrolase 2-B isoform X2 [Leptopilina heterotoma]
MEIILISTRKTIKLLCLLMGCLMKPVTAIRKLKRPVRCPPISNKLLFLSASELARKIRRKEISSEEVVTAYIDRCREVNPVLNAIVQDRFEAALIEARNIDKKLKNENKTEEEWEKNVPLLGVPVTVKESIGVQGMSNSAGVKWSTPKIAFEDADVIRRTRLAGGIPLLVSNTPELCMCWETYNNVIGTTKNPYDTRRTPGGSSGGEAALLGSGASVLSLASDIGGSCRLPAMFCGVFGHKPTPGWISVSGHMPGCADESWPSYFCIAPMTRFAQDLPMFLKVISQDPQVSNRLSQKVDLKKIRYFYMDFKSDKGIINTIDKDVKLAINQLTKHLENIHGVTVQKIQLKDLEDAFEFSTISIVQIDGVESIFMKGTDPKKWKSVNLEILKYLCFLSPHNFHAIFYGLVKKTVDMLPKSFKNRMIKKNDSVKKYIEDLLGDDGILICPTFSTSAFFHYEMLQYVYYSTFMTIFNSLGLPVTQCPMGITEKGLPVGLQIAAKSNCDHLTIAVAQEIERIFGGWQPPPSNEDTI